jgi:hypothetical protein
VYLIPFTAPFMAAEDFPDWVDGVLSVAGLITPGEDFPDWTKATGQVSNVFPNPPPVTGFFAWYDATRITGVTDGTSLVRWGDVSGNRYDATEAVTPPTYHASGPNIINGLPVVTFDGATNLLTATTMPAVVQPLTMFAVFKAVSWTITGSSNPVVIDSPVTGPAVFGDVSAGSVWAIASSTPATSATALDTNLHQFAAQFNSPNSRLLLDNAQIIAPINCGANGLVAGVTCIGASSVALGGFFHGSMGEIIVYNSALSGAQMTSTYNYLKAKWGTP